MEEGRGALTARLLRSPLQSRPTTKDAAPALLDWLHCRLPACLKAHESLEQVVNYWHMQV